MTPYYDEDGITIYHGDCRDLLGSTEADACVTDPPYGETALEWDRWPDGWPFLIQAPQMWCFGSMRMVLDRHGDFDDWTFAQDVVWEKQNGSGSHADRFRRVHETATHWYRGAWGDLSIEPQVTNDATARQVRRKQRPPHWGHIDESSYTSVDGGPRLMRSVLYHASCHGYAVHPTQKPIGILAPLIRYSCPPGGVVLDPFAGSGSTLLAARQEGRRAIGIEAREDYCEAAVARLAQGVLAL